MSTDVGIASKQRIIGRWKIGETFKKERYSWEKRGQDIKTGKIVGLKFIESADIIQYKEQQRQVNI